MVSTLLYYLEGDMFTSPAQCIVNTVNIVGVMGKGIALAFKEKYPDMFLEYKKTSGSVLYTVEGKNTFLAYSTAMISL